MLTRSKARLQKLVKENKMENEQVKNVPVSVEESEEVEIYNQLGDQEVIEREARETREELSEIMARGQQQNYETSESRVMEMPRSNDMQMMLEMLKSLTEGQKSQQEDIKMIRVLKEGQDKLVEDNKVIKLDLIQVREEIKATNNKFAAELQALNQALREEIKSSKEEWKEEVKKTEQRFEKIVKQNNENYKSEINKSTKNLSDNLNRINQEVRKEIKEVKTMTTENKEENRRIIKQQENMEEQIRKLAEEKGRRIDEVKETQEQLQRKVSELESRPSTSNHTTVALSQDIIKDVKYNGREAYPMEFLQELKEIKEQFYPNRGIKWISRHLEGEAMIWWRIVQQQINTYEQFEEAFIRKYWNQQVQEGIRDNLEFGSYKSHGGLSMIQYFERKILQCRQLIPPITEQHLIRKLARHYGKEIEVAIITRGINNVEQFEHLLREFATITERESRNWFNKLTNRDESHSGRIVNDNIRGKGWKKEGERERFVKREGGQNLPFERDEKTVRPSNVNTLTVEGQCPNTSPNTNTKNGPLATNRHST
jgi:DNA repair exonuclease SbcCD ATPase subunit